jgi:uncharacterized protein YbjQ (UPF0145 family)
LANANQDAALRTPRGDAAGRLSNGSAGAACTIGIYNGFPAAAAASRDAIIGTDIMTSILDPRRAALAVIAVGALLGCASTPQNGIESKVDEVKVYDHGQIAAIRYDVLSHIWADSWRSAYGMPLHPNEAQGVASLRAEAARLGANGLVNVVCLDQGRSNWWASPAPAYLCYGIAVRVKASAG